MRNIREILANNLRHYRDNAKLTQKQLVKKAGVSLRHYQDIEKSMKRWPQPDILEPIAEVLGVEVHNLFNPQKLKPVEPTIEALSELITQKENELKVYRRVSKNAPIDIIELLPLAEPHTLHTIRNLLSQYKKESESDKAT